MNEDAFKDGGSSPPNSITLSRCLSRYCGIPLDIRPAVDEPSHLSLDGDPFFDLGVFRIPHSLAQYTTLQEIQGMFVALASPEGAQVATTRRDFSSRVQFVGAEVDSIRAYQRGSKVAVLEELTQ